MGDKSDTECRSPLAKTPRYRGLLPHLFGKRKLSFTMDHKAPESRIHVDKAH